MQTTSTAFNNRANGTIRPLNWNLSMSFVKNYDAAIDFFTVGVSAIEGGDIIAGDNDVITSWDKYDYTDYSDRLMEMEYSRGEEVPFSVTLAMADFKVTNHDDYFTPSGGSVIEDYILPFRPLRLQAGFKNELVPVFVGITEKMPDVEDDNTASFHAVDFLHSLFNRPIGESVILQNVTTDEALAALFQLVGLGITQYVLDYGFNLIPFVYFDAATTFGDAIRELMEAEQGRLYMDELGIIRFKNRQNYDTTPVWFFDKSNVISKKLSKQDQIINKVIVTARVRELQENQKYWASSQSYFIGAGETLDVWAEFEDPVTTVDAPAYNAPINESIFLTNTIENGDGDLMPLIVLNSTAQFAKAYKMTFENTDTRNGYIYLIELFTTPAKVIDTIKVTEQDAASVIKYEEQVLEIDNDFIQTRVDAISKALMIIEDYKELGSVVEMEVKGTPALQIGDPVLLSLDGASGTYVVSKQAAGINGRFWQRLTVRKKTFRTYFTVEQSAVGGDDVISP